jgi:cytochrome P450
MLPAFHREQVEAAQAVMAEEAERAVEPWRTGERLDLYAWTRRLALRVAMRALFGLDPDRAAGDIDAAGEFERALSFYSRDYLLQTLRGPRTPWATMANARRRLDAVLYREIARRRAHPEAAGEDVMSLLVLARDEDGSELSEREVRDQVMTLLFAGHDTTTSTVAFLFRELARAPHVAERLAQELARVLDGGPPSAEQLADGLPELEMAVDETLRLYPPAWVGPRRSVEPFEFGGHTVPAGVAVNYCSWASHRLPDVFEDPDAFIPERFAPEARARLPKGAYVPFGGGSRTCIGMRFGLMEARVIAATVLRRFRLELPSNHELSIRQMPTLSPRGGLPMTVRGR